MAGWKVEMKDIFSVELLDKMLVVMMVYLMDG